MSLEVVVFKAAISRQTKRYTLFLFKFIHQKHAKTGSNQAIFYNFFKHEFLFSTKNIVNKNEIEISL